MGWIRRIRLSGVTILRKVTELFFLFSPGVRDKVLIGWMGSFGFWKGDAKSPILASLLLRQLGLCVEIDKEGLELARDWDGWKKERARGVYPP